MTFRRKISVVVEFKSRKEENINSTFVLCDHGEVQKKSVPMIPHDER